MRDTQPTPNNIVHEPDAARYIGLSQAFLRQARAQGRGPAYLKIGRAIRYRVQDLDAFLTGRRVETRDCR